MLELRACARSSSRIFGIAYSNPDTTPPEASRFAIRGEIHEAVAPNEFGVQEIVMPAGRCVVIRHVGSPDQIGEAMAESTTTYRKCRLARFVAHPDRHKRCRTRLLRSRDQTGFSRRD
ncbi:hypothetical protein GC387_34170 [Pseudomonas sp. MWU12-2323]|nr:hypothetical protein [Pseudomonas sp. MWU12-2323]